MPAQGAGLTLTLEFNHTLQKGAILSNLQLPGMCKEWHFLCPSSTWVAQSLFHRSILGHDKHHHTAGTALPVLHTRGFKTKQNEERFKHMQGNSVKTLGHLFVLPEKPFATITCAGRAMGTQVKPA